MDRKDRKFFKRVIIKNVIVVVFSIFLWIRYGTYIGILITMISIWTSFIAIRIMMNRYGVCEYGYVSNNFRDRLIRKLIRQR